MADNKMHLGHSPLTDRIYLGRQKGNTWSGEKRDVTNEFLQVMEHKFPIGTTQNISINGENKYRVIVVSMDAKITVNGVDPFTKNEDDK